MLVKSVTIYITAMQCFQQKRQRWRYRVKYGNFIQSPKAEMFRKRTGNGASIENVLAGRSLSTIPPTSILVTMESIAFTLTSITRRVLLQKTGNAQK